MNSIPLNIIIMWSGSIANIPSGWFLCNGSNGTPDLRNRFVVGAGSTYSLQSIGGSKDAIVVSHTHTAAVGSSPNHDHTVPAAVQQSFFAGNLANLRFNAQGGGAARGVDGGNSQHSHSALNANNAGESGTDKNLPPYYALAYIMYGGV